MTKAQTEIEDLARSYEMERSDPAKAVELAIADHKAHAGTCVDWDFIAGLRNALLCVKAAPVLISERDALQGGDK